MLGARSSGEVFWDGPPKNKHDAYLEGTLEERRDDSQIRAALIEG